MKQRIFKNRIFIGDPFHFEKDPNQPFGKVDKSAIGFSWRPGQEEVELRIENCQINANGVAEGLKLSYMRNVVVKDTIITGGYEDCVDIVRGENILFENCIFVSENTKHHFTIKCQVKNVKIVNCIFRNNFSKIYDGAFVDMGNWSDYDVGELPKTRDIKIINCNFENVSWWKKILTRRLYAENAIVTNTKGFNLRIPDIFVKMFWKYKRYLNK